MRLFRKGMNISTSSSAPNSDVAETVPAGKLAPWDVGELPAQPEFGRRHWLALIGPGLLMAGMAIGAGEWLFGPAISGQYGGTLLWLATISILCQVFFNLEVTRYTLYCGEPVLVGYFRTRPGPKLWTVWYLLMEFSNIWPFMAATAAIPLAAAMLGHLPGEATVSLGGISLFGMSENMFVKVLGYMVFILAFVPLIFGGTIYKMLERLMVIKVVLVLGFLSCMVIFTVSRANVQEVLTGFFRFGTVPIRAETVIDGPHFSVKQQDDPGRKDSAVYIVKGTVEEDGKPLVTVFSEKRNGETTAYKVGGKPVRDKLPDELIPVHDRMLDQIMARAQKDRFFVESTSKGNSLRIQGRVIDGRTWEPEEIVISKAGQEEQSYKGLDEVPESMASQARGWVKHRGFERVGLIGYIREYRRLPDLDWPIVAALFAIAGAGGLSNTLLSNYARDKGWGMGKLVGAIPSAVGGRTITLSHVGKVFKPGDETHDRWRGWMRFIIRDQLVVWMVCCFVGMALPCMLSLEFIRNVPVSGDRVTAEIANGVASRFPEYRSLLWPLTLICSFMILAPGAIFSGEAIARRWTDIIWTTSARAQKLEGNQVKYIYYSILSLYAAWGLVALALFDPLQLAKIGAVLGNVALGFTSFHTLIVNRTLLPKPLRPGWFMQAGLIASGIFSLGICAIVVATL